MNIYSIEIPKLAPGTFHPVNGVMYHTQDPRYPKKLSRHFWNPDKKSFDEVEPYNMVDTILVPLMMCHPEDVKNYVDFQLPHLKEYYGESLNIFVCHTSLQEDPVYVGLFMRSEIGENIWNQ